MNFFERRKLTRQLAGADFALAGELLSKQFAGSVIPQELISLLHRYMDAPGIDAALQLIEYDCQFAAVFELSKSPLSRSLLSTTNDHVPGESER